ncbi:hypothetical protein LIER_36842 [Lithospermum erythrorhizon]|uniref:DUF4283 domain-containing protein n=1 Tax=Lithospermum erythrorhizon TaxID=34254 RepID=A0AAV3PE55_LITER
MWLVKTNPMCIFKWTTDFDSSKESPLKPIWMHFPVVPLYLYEGEGLLSVANSIGKPLRADSLNTNHVKLGVPSVCVELDISKPLVNEVWINFEDDEDPDSSEGFWQKVEYDETLTYYSKCFYMGHSLEDCKRDFEKERLQAAKGKKAMDDKPGYVTRRHYRHVYNSKASQTTQRDGGVPIALKPAACSASTSAPITANNDVQQTEDTTVVFAATEEVHQANDLSDINVAFHVESPPYSPKAIDNLANIRPESVTPVENQALKDGDVQLTDKSLDPFLNVE